MVCFPASHHLKITPMTALPIELEQYIFEHAAKNHHSSAVALSLVARRVRRWIEPVIYKCVTLKYESDKSKRVLKGFLSVLQTKPASFFATHVKRLFLSDIPTSYIMKILMVCTGLKDLRIWPHTPLPVMHFVVTSSIRPTHLSLSAKHLAEYCGVPNFDIPFYAELTHLELYDLWWQLIGWAPSFSILPQLTHLALVSELPFWCGSIASYGLSTMLADCSKLEVCVLRCMLSEEELRLGQDAVIANSFADPRVVVMPWHHSKAQWVDGSWNEKAEIGT